MNSGIRLSVAQARTEMSGPSGAWEGGILTDRTRRLRVRESIPGRLTEFFVAVNGGGDKDFLILQITNKYILLNKNMDHLLIVNHDTYPSRLCPYI